MKNGMAPVYIPDGTEEKKAIARTTHLAISAHQDDIEFMAYAPIAECFGKADKWFGGVVVTDGAGSPRSGLYADYTDEEMKEVRITEQKKAAAVGEYSFQMLLGHPSKEVKDPRNTAIVKELAEIIRQAKPKWCIRVIIFISYAITINTAMRQITAWIVWMTCKRRNRRLHTTPGSLVLTSMPTAVKSFPCIQGNSGKLNCCFRRSLQRLHGIGSGRVAA